MYTCSAESGLQQIEPPQGGGCVLPGFSLVFSTAGKRTFQTGKELLVNLSCFLVLPYAGQILFYKNFFWPSFYTSQEKIVENFLPVFKGYTCCRLHEAVLEKPALSFHLCYESLQLIFSLLRMLSIYNGIAEGSYSQGFL